MTLSFDVPDLELTRIAGILDSLHSDGNINDTKLKPKLEGIASAAFHEYLKMIEGQKVFTRGSDFLEYRLFLLIKHVFENKLPDIDTICSYFQDSQTEARSLLRSVISKYQYDLVDTIQLSLKDHLESISPKGYDENEGTFEAYSENIVESMNRILLSEHKASLEPIVKEKNTISVYRIQRETYEVLCQKLGVELKSWEAETT